MNNSKQIQKLRICLIGPAYPYRGGISHYNTCLAKELMKDHEVRVINYSRLYPEFLFPGRTQYDESAKAFSVPSRRMIDSINPFTWVRAGFHAARWKPDLTVVQWWHPYFAPALAKICSILRLTGRGKVIFLCHNVAPHEQSAVDRILSRLAFSCAHGFLVQSSEDRAKLRRIRKKSPARLHPHPLYDFFKKGEMTVSRARDLVGEPPGPLLLFFGYVRAYKGLVYLLRAMPAIRDRTGARLLVVGEFYEDRE
ncbi:MAG: glycosyltransferase, partial [Candidatus Krumholzibacteriota bacterium]|nr:glycosyltransferase [Candidatus Krumholzibacteriota bacterium]